MLFCLSGCYVREEKWGKSSHTAYHCLPQWRKIKRSSCRCSFSLWLFFRCAPSCQSVRETTREQRKFSLFSSSFSSSCLPFFVMYSMRAPQKCSCWQHDTNISRCELIFHSNFLFVIFHQFFYSLVLLTELSYHDDDINQLHWSVKGSLLRFVQFITLCWIYTHTKWIVFTLNCCYLFYWWEDTDKWRIKTLNADLTLQCCTWRERVVNFS